MKKIILFFFFTTQIIFSQENSPVFEKDTGGATSLLKNYLNPLSFHKPTYILVYTSPVKFQFSVKYRLLLSKNKDLMSGFYLAYTQKSFWDAWNLKDSQPFLESNYNPELFYLFELTNFNFFKFFMVGYEHESNGEGAANTYKSRSWDKLNFSVNFHFFNDHLIFIPKGWFVLSTSSNNYNIRTYRGNFEFRLKTNVLRNFYNSRIELTFWPGGEGNLKYSSLELTNSLGPFLLKGLNSLLPIIFYVQLWHGYGESLIAYKTESTKIRLGFRLDF